MFEDKAELLAKSPELKAEFERTKNTSRVAGNEMNASEQLEWVYKHSAHYAKEYNRLPVFKVF